MFLKKDSQGHVADRFIKVAPTCAKKLSETSAAMAQKKLKNRKGQYTEM